MKYRPEVDGLRALAIIPVVLFHAGFSSFSGGFIGVDTFFVISGYLITGILVSDHADGRFSFKTFYERRARRILPALFFVIGCCIPVAWLLMMPSDMLQFSRSVSAVPLFVSNILFWRESGYFEAGVELKPLLHTWSLAVEEQFYLVFPIILAVLWRLGPRLLTALAFVGGCASFALAQWGASNRPDAAFYLLPTRAWELLIGVMVALIVHQNWGQHVGIGPRNFASILGLGMLAAAVYAFDGNTLWPSYHTLLPTLGTALILLFGTGGTAVAWVLERKWLVGVGLISYSAYLWHQPLFAFVRYWLSGEPDALTATAICVATFVLAYATWRYIEQPFRRGRVAGVRSHVLWYSVAGSSLLVLIGFGIRDSTYLESRMSSRQKETYSALHYNETSEYKQGWRPGTCFMVLGVNGLDRFDLEGCLQEAPGKRNYLLLGDSYAAQFWAALQLKFPEVNVIQATAAGCRPLLSTSRSNDCTKLMKYLLTSYLKSGVKIDGVILSAKWDVWDEASFIDTLQLLKRDVPRVIVLGEMASFTRPLPTLIVRYMSDSGELSLVGNRFVRKDRLELGRRIREVSREAMVEYYSVVDAACPDQRCNVFTALGVPILFDDEHFTLGGAIRTIDRLTDGAGFSLN
jgi:peptidoglycan/LPS O-acetylase OafA/YrhL